MYEDCTSGLRYISYIDDFNENKNSVLSKFRLLEVLEVSIYHDVAVALDELENDLISYCYSQSGSAEEPISDVFTHKQLNEKTHSTLKIIVSSLISAHKKLRP